MKAADALSSRRAVAIGRLAMVTGGSPVEWGRPAGPASAGTGRRQVVDRPLRSGRLGGDPLAGPDERATDARRRRRASVRADRAWRAWRASAWSRARRSAWTACMNWIW